MLGTSELVRTHERGRSLAVRKINPRFLGCPARDYVFPIYIQYKYYGQSDRRLKPSAHLDLLSTWGVTWSYPTFSLVIQCSEGYE